MTFTAIFLKIFTGSPEFSRAKCWEFSRQGFFFTGVMLDQHKILFKGKAWLSSIAVTYWCWSSLKYCMITMDNSKDTNKNEPTSPHFGKVWSTISFVNYKLSSVDKSYLPSQAKTSKWVDVTVSSSKAFVLFQNCPSPLETAPLIKIQKESFKVPRVCSCWLLDYIYLLVIFANEKSAIWQSWLKKSVLNLCKFMVYL